MGIMSSVIQQLAQTGAFTHDETIGDVKFTLGILGHEETMLTDGLANIEELYKDIAGEESKMMVYNSAMDNFRMITRLSLIIRAVNDIPPIKLDGTLEERIESIKDFRSDLLLLDPAITSRLNEAYNELVEKRFKFFEKTDELAKK